MYERYLNGHYDKDPRAPHDEEGGLHNLKLHTWLNWLTDPFLHLVHHSSWMFGVCLDPRSSDRLGITHLFALLCR